MRVTVWGINYAPELTGIAPYNTALCEFLQQAGHAVRMITTFAYYPSWTKSAADRRRVYRTDVINDVPVYRCWHFVPRRVTTFKRILHEGSFALTSLLRQLALPRADVYVVISPPLLLGAAAWFLGLLKQAPFVFHIQDLQPDAAAGLGMLKPGTFLRLLYRLERIAYRKAARVSGISRGMLAALRQKNVPEEKLIYFPNGVDLPDLETRREPGWFRTRHGFDKNDCLVVYSGNLGVKQGLEVLIEAARLVRHPRLRFVICGDGNRREHLSGLIRRDQLANVRLLPLQPVADYQAMLNDADVCVITQQRGSSRFFFPSKLLPTLALARPVVTVADPESELVRALESHRFGINVEPGDPKRLAETFAALADRPDWLREAGQAGRRFVEQFEARPILRQFESALRELHQSRG